MLVFYKLKLLSPLSSLKLIFSLLNTLLVCCIIYFNFAMVWKYTHAIKFLLLFFFFRFLCCIVAGIKIQSTIVNSTMHTIRMCVLCPMLLLRRYSVTFSPHIIATSTTNVLFRTSIRINVATVEASTRLFRAIVALKVHSGFGQRFPIPHSRRRFIDCLWCGSRFKNF